MKFSWKLLLIVGFLVVLPGCVSNLAITYRSEPLGAALYQGDQHMGTTPVTLTYKLTEEDKRAGYKQIRGTSVRWISGASASTGDMTAYLSDGRNQSFTFRRPDGVPGYDVDANYALQLQRNAIMMLQSAAQLQQAAAAQRQAQEMERMRQQQLLQQNAPINCQSSVVLGTVHTTCR